MEIDLDEVERELKDISPWPWDFCNSTSEIANKYGSVLLGIGSHRYGGVGRNRIGFSNSDFDFIAESPERIAELVRLVKEAKVVADHCLEMSCILTALDGSKASKFLENFK